MGHMAGVTSRGRAGERNHFAAFQAKLKYFCRWFCHIDLCWTIIGRNGFKPVKESLINTKSLDWFALIMNRFVMNEANRVFGNLEAELSCPIWISEGLFNSSPPGQNGHHFADVIFRCIFWMKSFALRLKFHWSLPLRVQLKITPHWFRYWLGTEQVASHYLNQCWPDSLMHICGTRGRWVDGMEIYLAPISLMILYQNASWTHISFWCDSIVGNHIATNSSHAATSQLVCHVHRFVVIVVGRF